MSDRMQPSNYFLVTVTDTRCVASGGGEGLLCIFSYGDHLQDSSREGINHFSATSSMTPVMTGVTLHVLGFHQRWCQGRNSGGRAKIVKVPTANEESKIFTDHTFLIGSKFDKTL